MHRRGREGLILVAPAEMNAPFSAVPGVLHTVQYVGYYVFVWNLYLLPSGFLDPLGQLFLAFSKGARLITFHHCIYETFHIIEKHLRVPLGHSHPVLGALEVNMPTICNFTTSVHT